MISLLPCPFCCSPAIMINTGEYRVECTRVGDCYGKRGTLGYTHESDAAERWNMRASKWHYRCADHAGMLIPTLNGWICPFCDYTQN